MNSLKDLKNVGRDDILAALGLTRSAHSPAAEPAILPLFGMLGFGALLGFGIGLLVAPKSGAQLRQQLSEQLTQQLDESDETDVETLS